MELSTPSGPQVVSDSTKQVMSSVSSQPPLSTKQKVKASRKRKCAMLESAATTKRKTSSVKCKTSRTSTQTTRSSKTSDQGSTTDEKASKGFWNESTMAMSKRLWLPTKIDCADMDSNSWNSSSKRLAQGSWFTVTHQQPKERKMPTENLPMTSLPCATTLWPKIMACVQRKIDESADNDNPIASHARKKRKPNQPSDEKKEEAKQKKSTPKKKKTKTPAGKVRKIRLFPTKQQRQILLRWFGTVRWTFNQCLTAVQTYNIPRTKEALRDWCLNANSLEGHSEMKWVFDTPYDVRDEGMNDLLKAFKTCFANKKAANIDKFRIHYRTRKTESESLVIHSKHWKSAGVFHPTVWGKEPIEAAEPLPDKLKYDARLKRNRLGEFFLCVPLALDVKQGDNQTLSTPNKRIEDGILALDPGVRTFQTGYSPSGLIVEWAKNDIKRIQRLCFYVDALQSAWSQTGVTHRRRYKMKRAARKARKRIRNLVDETHKKMCKWIVENYHTVLLPSFDTSQMVKRRANRKLGNNTARMMLSWSHYRFKQRLLDKVREYTSCRVIICDEHYTSKTCGNCGKINNRLYGNKTFICPNCHVKLDRDANAARNILLRYLTRHVFESDPAMGLALGLGPLSLS